MITAVLDTNTIVSATLVAQGIPNRLLEAARAQRFRLVISAVIIDEVVQTLGRDRVRRKYGLTDSDVERVRRALERRATVTPLTS